MSVRSLAMLSAASILVFLKFSEKNLKNAGPITLFFSVSIHISIRVSVVNGGRISVNLYIITQ